MYLAYYIFFFFLGKVDGFEERVCTVGFFKWTLSAKRILSNIYAKWPIIPFQSGDSWVTAQHCIYLNVDMLLFM